MKKITARQAEARRANGKLSPGPKTPAAKARSSMNALKFGFFAMNPLLPGESEADFAEFRMGWADSFKPVDHAEQSLVNRIADSAWRLRRFPAVEAGLYTAELLSEQAWLAKRQARDLIEHRLFPTPEEAKDPQLYRKLQAREQEIREVLNSPQYAMGRAFRRDARHAGGFTRLSRCEMLLERGFYRCLNELLRLQEIRRHTQYQRQNEPTNVDGTDPGAGRSCRTDPFLP